MKVIHLNIYNIKTLKLLQKIFQEVCLVADYTTFKTIDTRRCISDIFGPFEKYLFFSNNPRGTWIYRHFAECKQPYLQVATFDSTVTQMFDLSLHNATITSRITFSDEGEGCIAFQDNGTSMHDYSDSVHLDKDPDINLNDINNLLKNWLVIRAFKIFHPFSYDEDVEIIQNLTKYIDNNHYDESIMGTPLDPFRQQKFIVLLNDLDNVIEKYEEVKPRHRYIYDTVFFGPTKNMRKVLSEMEILIAGHEELGKDEQCY